VAGAEWFEGLAAGRLGTKGFGRGVRMSGGFAAGAHWLGGSAARRLGSQGVYGFGGFAAGA
jgi:hypothetical protein